MNKLKSFSLIELMVVIAIVGILSAIAVPSYKLYVARTKIASVIPILEGYKTKAVEYYNAVGSYPQAQNLGYATGGTTYDLANPGTIFPGALRLVISDCIGKGFEIEAEFDKTYFGLEDKLWIYYRGIVNNDVVNWTCGPHPSTTYSPDSTIKYLPSNCQTRVIGCGDL